MRALPADSVEYFDETEFGKTALLGAEVGAAVGLAAVVAGLDVAGAVGAGVDVGEAAGVAAGGTDAVEPHSALRKSFHFMPLRVPAVCAALYLALHSFIVNA
jgi:hypothetical protein